MGKAGFEPWPTLWVEETLDRNLPLTAKQSTAVEPELQTTIQCMVT
jgi:hypothetical protein